ncbi:MAG: WYL domain-containing protein [Candidatus Krumholzibacteria bacterium]|nr:WYL domain-containing protein [Candidatus Krumholzibacteria bacterium]
MVASFRHQGLQARTIIPYPDVAIVTPRSICCENTSYIVAEVVCVWPDTSGCVPFDPLLALHRIQKVALTDTPFAKPADYDFEKTFNEQFGVIKQKRFTVKAELTGWAAGYTAERKLSPDQKITRRKGGKLVIQFSATSEPEVLNWVLSLGV